MKAVNFENSNKILGRPAGTTEKECGPLHIYCDNKYCLSRWRGSWLDRLRFLFTGDMWLWVWSGQTQPPVMLQTEHPWPKKNDK